MAKNSKFGRPLKFKSVDELQKKIDLYFESCFELGDDGKKKKIKPFTVTGLSNFLDVDRKTLINYQDKDEDFFHTIKKAKSKIEEDIEIGALTNAYNPTSSIFNLKNNFGWVDKMEVNNNNINTNIEIDVKSIEGKSAKELSDMRKKLMGE